MNTSIVALFFWLHVFGMNNLLIFGPMEEKKLKELGQSIKSLRSKNKETRYELAKALGVKFDTIKKLEDTGQSNICTLIKVCNHYKAEVRLLIKK